MSEFYDHFMELVTDPAHLAFEVFTTFILEIVILGLLLPLIARRIRREHRQIDIEHGVNHDDWFFADLNLDPDLPIDYIPTHRGVPRG
jgi:hypothetical protein